MLRAAETDLWWQRGVIYQVYPRSFQDTNGDGIGDLTGILERLDYCTHLGGVDAIWLSPDLSIPDGRFRATTYPTTRRISIRYSGSLEDFDRLLIELKRRGNEADHGLRAESHFRSARLVQGRALQSDRAPGREWYLWRDAAPGGAPPNNWLSHFGGSAWEWEPQTGQYYYHSFLKEQPDLNWRNPQVLAAMA